MYECKKISSTIEILVSVQLERILVAIVESGIVYTHVL